MRPAVEMELPGRDPALGGQGIRVALQDGELIVTQRSVGTAAADQRHRLAEGIAHAHQHCRHQGDASTQSQPAVHQYLTVSGELLQDPISGAAQFFR